MAQAQQAVSVSGRHLYALEPACQGTRQLSSCSMARWRLSQLSQTKDTPAATTCAAVVRAALLLAQSFVVETTQQQTRRKRGRRGASCLSMTHGLGLDAPSGVVWLQLVIQARRLRWLITLIAQPLLSLIMRTKIESLYKVRENKTHTEDEGWRY